MTTFCVQFHPASAPLGAAGRIVAAFRKAIATADVIWGDDKGEYVNIMFESPSTATGWAVVSHVFGLPEIEGEAGTACIVTCQGEQGWDDYLLLHHYDRSLTVDAVPGGPAPM